MIIDVIGKSKHLDHEECTQMIDFMTSFLLSPVQKRHLYITQSFHQDDAVPNLDAYINVIDDAKRPKEFFIWTKPSRPYADQAKAIAHELVHMKQYHCREVCPKTGAILSAELRSLQNVASNDPYWESPAEVEAYGREVGLYNRWLTERLSRTTKEQNSLLVSSAAALAAYNLDMVAEPL